MDEDFLEYIKEEIRYIVTENSRERVETVKLRLLDEYDKKMLTLCVSMYLLVGIASREEVLVEIGKHSLLVK